jgi:mannose-6-phosphate isomerase-like protein (cupin superfamily)
MLRRSLLSVANLALVPAQLLGAAYTGTRNSISAIKTGQDREGKRRSIGLSSTTYKVLTSDTDGALFVLEQANTRKGGPSRHVHHHEDELFFCLEGQYVVEIGRARVVLKQGDCVLGPRGIPHAWAFSGEKKGRMLISFAPAGKMEAFFAKRETSGIEPGEYASSKADVALLAQFGMDLVGPPIPISTL